MVDATNARGVSIDDSEGGDVFDDFGKSPCNRVGADSAKLMDGRDSGDDSVIINADMACEGAIIREDDVVA